MLKAWVTLISYWHRATEMDDRTFAKKAVSHLMNNDIKESEWISTVRIVLKLLGLERYFNQPSLLTTEKLKEIVTKKLKENFTREWSTSLASQVGSLRFYKRFKIEFSREGYLDTVPCYKLRKLISKFRCSDHKLEIEVGRRKKVLADERTCNICMNGVVNVNVNVKSVGGGGPLPQKHVVCVVLAVYIVHYRHCSPGDRSLRKCNDFVSVRIRGKETNSDQNQSSGPPEPQPNRAPLKSSGFRCLMPKRSKGRLWT